MKILVELEDYNFQKAKIKIAQHLIDNNYGITVSEIRERTGTDLRTIQRWLADGKLIKIARGKRTFSQEDAIELLTKQGFKITKK